MLIGLAELVGGVLLALIFSFMAFTSIGIIVLLRRRPTPPDRS